MSKEIFTPYFKDGYKSFKILPNIRHSKLPKDQLIKILAEMVCEINPLNIVDLTNPEYTIVAEVIKATLCLTVLRDFLKFKKFNILEIVSPTPVPHQKTDPAAAAAGTPMEQEDENKDNGNVEDKPMAATDEEILEDNSGDVVKPTTDLQQSAPADVQDA
jgi:tRNA acetyltransferase TAN1